MSKITFLSTALILISTTFASSSLYADDFDYEDIDLDFAFHKKSTIEDFPAPPVPVIPSTGTLFNSG